MSEIEHPVQSTKNLLVALIAASLLASILFVCVVMPAEYGMDPSGMGSRLGLLVLSEQASVDAANNGSQAGQDSEFAQQDEVSITVPPRRGLEYKFHLEQYAKLKYEWNSGEDILYFDLHGEPDGDSKGYFESFAEAEASEMKGSMTAPFTGSHGWYFRNNSPKEVTVVLKTEGDYTILGLR